MSAALWNTAVVELGERGATRFVVQDVSEEEKPQRGHEGDRSESDKAQANAPLCCQTKKKELDYQLYLEEDFQTDFDPSDCDSIITSLIAFPSIVLSDTTR